MADNEFEKCRNLLSDMIWHILMTGDVTVADFEAKCRSIRENDTDKKAIVDQAYRDVLSYFIKEDKGKEYYENIVAMAINSCTKDLCNATLPVILLADLFDCQTIDKCEELFEFVETRVDVWKKDLFFNNTKNNLLRMCNDLLRRLSRSQNTVFCGRILLFLAKFFPLSERSGLNIVSEFNLDNLTVYVSKDEGDMEVSIPDKNREEGECNESGITILNYDMYRRFWSLQEYFRNPNMCYNKLAWKTFSAHSSSVLSVFVSFKLDDVKSANKKLDDIHINSANKNVYFAKYLTSQKLLDLQLSDNNFRRYVLLQFLILFQYLAAQVKFKPENYVLSEDQVSWIQKTTEEIYKILEETPPDGKRFAETIKHTLKREEYWNKWKNEGCPEFHTNKQEDVDRKTFVPERPRKRFGEEIRTAIRSNKILIGNAELTRLWNLCPDNMEACRSQKRDFLPTLEGFFEEAVEQNELSSGIEEEYKNVYDSNYGWRALRLLSRRSPHFFTSSNQPIRELPVYLKSMIKRLAKELPQAAPEDVKMENNDKEEVGAAAEESEEELLDNSEEKTKEENVEGKIKDDPESLPVCTIPSETLLGIATELVHKWKGLARHLKFEEDEIAYFESEHSDPVEQVNKMLIVWTEREVVTIESLKNALHAVGESTVANMLNS